MLSRVLSLAVAVLWLQPANWASAADEAEYKGVIQVVANVVIERSEDVEVFKSLAEGMMSQTRAEDGNISYELQQSIEDPKEFTFIETWGSPEALKTHLGMKHFTAFAGKAIPLMRDKKVASIKSYKRLFKGKH